MQHNQHIPQMLAPARKPFSRLLVLGVRLLGRWGSIVPTPATGQTRRWISTSSASSAIKDLEGEIAHADAAYTEARSHFNNLDAQPSSDPDLLIRAHQLAQDLYHLVLGKLEPLKDAETVYQAREDELAIAQQKARLSIPRTRRFHYRQLVWQAYPKATSSWLPPAVPCRNLACGAPRAGKTSISM